MILQRIATSIRTQDWFTVLIETLIVVLGVFLGLQAQQWILERDRQNREGAYLARLHDEVVQLQSVRARYDESRRAFSADLVSAVRVLQDPSAGSLISVEQCDAIAGSSHTTVPPADLPAITELLSTGRLDEITSNDVRASILNLTQDSTSAKDLIQLIGQETESLGRAFPQLMRYDLGESPFNVDDYWLSPVCDTEGMRADPVFMNALIDNAYMYNVYAERGVLPISRRVQELHETLDETLGIVHRTEIGGPE
ncbi:MAG: hypothetical protein RLN72_02820 [Henriciella sp.]